MMRQFSEQLETMIISIPGGDNVWNDEAYGYDGNDTIMAVSGNTWIQGGAGDDIILVGR